MTIPPQTVLIVGSLHYDIMVVADHLPRRDETAVGSSWYPKFGGKGGNQAVAVVRAGAVSRMFGAVGNDAFGQFLRDHLRAGGVDDAHVATLPATASGISVAITDTKGDYAATIVSGANLCLDLAGLALAGVWQDVGVLILQNEVPDAINFAAATQARARGIKTLLNAAPARGLSADLIALIDILVVNAVEAEMMGAARVDSLPRAAAAAAQLAEQFETVIVTAGSLGLAACGKDHPMFSCPAEVVSVVSSHGAGDAFIGTLAASLVRGMDLATACQTASHAAAVHVSTKT